MLTTITARAGTLQVRRWLLWLVTLLPFLAGYGVGLAVKTLKLVVAAFLIGFENGAGTVKHG